MLMLYNGKNKIVGFAAFKKIRVFGFYKTNTDFVIGLWWFQFYISDRP